MVWIENSPILQAIRRMSGLCLGGVVEMDGSPDVTYGYNDRGERVSSEQSGIVNHSEVSYETIIGEVWRPRRLRPWVN